MSHTAAWAAAGRAGALRQAGEKAHLLHGADLERAIEQKRSTWVPMSRFAVVQAGHLLPMGARPTRRASS